MIHRAIGLESLNGDICFENIKTTFHHQTKDMELKNNGSHNKLQMSSFITCIGDK